MAKRLKNTTEAPILHNASGLSFAAGAYTTINLTDLAGLIDSQTYDLLATGSLVFNDGSADVADHASAWSSLSGENFLQKDSEFAPIQRLKMAPSGWTYQLRGCEFETSTLNALQNKDYTNADIGDLTVKFYSSQDSELTTQEDIDSSCVKTVVDFEPSYDYEIIGGTAKVAATPENNVCLWVIAVPDVPFGSGGSRVMISNLNFKHVTEADKVEANGRVSKRLNYNETYHTNKLRFIIRHSAGERHKFIVCIEHYRA